MVIIDHVYVKSCQKNYDDNDYSGHGSAGKLPALEARGAAEAGHNGLHHHPCLRWIPEVHGQTGKPIPELQVQ